MHGLFSFGYSMPERMDGSGGKRISKFMLHPLERGAKSV